MCPQVPGAELGIDSDGFFDLSEQPKRVAVVGTGYIGIELSGIFNALGSKVTIFSRTNQILRKFDSIIKDNVLAELKASGVDICCNASVKALKRTDGGICVEYEAEDKKGELEADCVLWAVGRGPNLKKLNLEAAGIKTSGKLNYIKVDEYQNTSAEGVYALGDVCGNFQLTPVAIAAGRKLADRLFGNKPKSHLEYENIPTVVFAHPTCGTIGLSEEEAREKYKDQEVKTYTSRFTNLYYAFLEHKQATAYKLIVVGPEVKVVGLHLFGKGSDEILQGFGVAIRYENYFMLSVDSDLNSIFLYRMGATKADFDNCVAIHPTAAEELVSQ